MCCAVSSHAQFRAVVALSSQHQEVVSWLSVCQVGPSRPLPSGESVTLKCTLGSFQEAPWTLQRLAELLLEPQKQYRKLHKVVRTFPQLNVSHILMCKCMWEYECFTHFDVQVYVGIRACHTF
jgi:PPP4R2